MKNLILTLICCFSTGMIMSQSCGQGGPIPSSGSALGGGSSIGSFSDFNSSASILNSMMSDIYSGQYLSSVTEYDKVKGSPFLQDEDSEGVLVMNDGTILENIPLKYDLYAREIIATKPDGEDIVLDTRYYKEMILDVEGQEVSYQKVNPKKPDHFYEVSIPEWRCCFL